MPTCLASIHSRVLSSISSCGKDLTVRETRLQIPAFRVWALGGSFKKDETRPFLTPSCLGVQKKMDLKWGKIVQAGHDYDFIVSFSETPAGESTGLVSLVQACDGVVKARLQLTAGSSFTSPTGKKILTDYQVFLLDSKTHLRANGVPTYYVAPEDNRPNAMIFRSSTDGSILASAKKTLVSQGSCGYAYWEVTNGQGLDPSLLSYVLSFQDNRNFECTGAPTPSMAPESSSAGVIIGSVALAGVVGICAGSAFLWRKYGHLFLQWKQGFRSL